MKRPTIVITRSTDRERLFLIPYIIFMTFTILSQSFYSLYIYSFTKIIIALSCAMLVLVEFFLGRTDKRSLVGFFVVLVLFFVTLMGSRNEQNNVPAMFLFIYCARNIRFDTVARKTVALSAFLLAFIIISAKLGIIMEYTTVQWQLGVMRERNYLGFRYALYPSTLMFNITCLLIYLKKKDISFWEAALLLLINYWFFSQTNSRLTFALATALIIISFSYKWIDTWIINRKVIMGVASFSYVICFGTSYYLTAFYDPGKLWMQLLNAFLGSRLSLGLKSLKENGIPILGQNISWIGNGLGPHGEQAVGQYTYVDSFYIQVLQHYGIIFVVLLLILMTVVMFRIKKTGDLYLFSVMVIIAFHFVIDDLQLYLFYNTFWLIVGSMAMTTIREAFPKGTEKNKQVSY